MKVDISDVHNSHGSVFTLSLEAEDKQDIKTIKFLKKQRKRLVFSDRGNLFYNYSFETMGNSCHIGFSEEGVRLATVDYQWNSGREDQKFPVLVIPGLNDQYDKIKQYTWHYTCHWCNKEIWGVERMAVEIYVPKGNSFERKLVQVHDSCQEIRERQMANIPFSTT